MRGHNISKCLVCLNEFICGDCITNVCPDCNRKLIKTLKVECPDGHGLQEAKALSFHGMKLACGCELEDGGGYGWLRKKDTKFAPKELKL